MFAVAAYSVPADTTDDFSVFARTHLAPVVRPYLFWTSQWQQWNLFSPNPLRRVVEYVIDWRIGATTYTVRLNEKTIPFYRDADELKILRRMEDNGPAWMHVRERYLALTCEEYAIPSGTTVRITFRYYVIPQHDMPASVAFWKRYRPKWQSIDGAEITCPNSRAV